MATVLENRDLLTIAEAARLLPGKPHPSTLWRWHTRGISGVRLRTVLCGGRRFVERSAINEFCAALTAAAEPQPSAPAERAPETCARLVAAGLV
jgi:hypothetical protein